MGEKWPDFKANLEKEIRSIASRSKVSKDQAVDFINAVTARSKGQIESPILETFLICNPAFHASPIAEVHRGFKQAFRTGNHPKAKGLDFQVEYPRSWSSREGKRPNVIQFLSANNGKGLAHASLITKDIIAEAGGKLSREESERFKTLKGANELASELFTEDNLREIQAMGRIESYNLPPSLFLTCLQSRIEILKN